MRNIFINKRIHECTDSHHRATVGSMKNVYKSVIYAVFAPLVGLFTDVYTPMAAFALLGIGTLAFLVCFIFLARLHSRAPQV